MEVKHKNTQQTYMKIDEKNEKKRDGRKEIQNKITT